MDKIGLIAGNRGFPLLFASQAKRKNPQLRIIAAGFYGETSGKLSGIVDALHWFNVGDLSGAIDMFSRYDVKTLVMAGQISPYRIFKTRKNWDSIMRQIAEKAQDFRPHSIFNEIIKEVENRGFEFISSLSYLDDFLAKDGFNNNLHAPQGFTEEINKYGMLAREIINLDIGQTVVFKDKAVVAVEALEGTDNTIKRGCRIAGKGAVVVKLARKNQDLRFDIPVIGLKTIKLLSFLKAKALVLDAGRCLILDKKEVFSLAEKRRMVIYGLGPISD